jgi:UDP-N-acetylglucosamine transferase subunit ALG13
MILLTVGAQVPFDRLVLCVDRWAADRGRTDVFAQIGRRAWRPQFIQWIDMMGPVEFRRKVADADVVVAHAGTGTILTALEFGKPIVVMPRRADLKETRNEHQLATAMQLQQLGYVRAAFSPQELVKLLDAMDHLPLRASIGTHASPELLATVRAFVLECKVPGGNPAARSGYSRSG